jgi:hypothetical protein
LSSFVFLFDPEEVSNIFFQDGGLSPLHPHYNPTRLTLLHGNRRDNLKPSTDETVYSLTAGVSLEAQVTEF